MWVSNFAGIIRHIFKGPILLSILAYVTTPREMAIEIRSKLIEMVDKEDREVIQGINIDDIQRFLPVGGHELAKGKGLQDK